jgi:hypothetical protein
MFICDARLALNPICEAYDEQLLIFALEASTAVNADDLENTATDERQDMLELLDARYAFPPPVYRLTMSY